MSARVAFVDRDGTLIEEPSDFQVDSLAKLRLAQGVVPALRRLQDAGFELVMVSNQDGLGTNSFPQKDFDEPHEFLMSLLASQGIGFRRGVRVSAPVRGRLRLPQAPHGPGERIHARAASGPSRQRHDRRPRGPTSSSPRTWACAVSVSMPDSREAGNSS